MRSSTQQQTRTSVEPPASGFHWQHSYRTLPAAMFVSVQPEKAPQPELVAFNHHLARALNMDAQILQQQAAQWLSGQSLPPGAEPLAQAYAGHQFGAPTMLGDGRAILLGEHLTDAGERFDIQLKGAGATPFSRRGDGHGTLDAMAREYLISEAMHALGIPTTRSLALVKTGRTVLRQRPLPGAVLTRVAASHIRVGTFQYAAWHEQRQTLLPALLDYTIKRHYPHLAHQQNPALALLDAVMQRHIALVVHWMRVGFIHGVMNTDNVTISGETMDYGPCAFLDEYEPGKVFSSIDEHGRYAFANQGVIAYWNMQRFAEALLPLISDDKDAAVEQATACLKRFMPQFDDACFVMLCNKLGLVQRTSDDENLVQQWLKLMQDKRLDYTLAHQKLRDGRLSAQLADDADFAQFHARWLQRFTAGGDQAEALMTANNPVIIPRNHQVERALQALVDGHTQPLHDLHAALAAPYAPRAQDDPYCQAPTSSERILATYCGT